SDIKAKSVSKVDQETDLRVPAPTLQFDGKISAVETDGNVASSLGCSKVGSRRRTSPEKGGNVQPDIYLTQSKNCETCAKPSFTGFLTM
uniref:Protein tyrosine phosphatase non-receptor type 12 n=1 Tax=Romanomermis culicivorax TaxID=13658 RepID=A0A915HHN6_ROMCU